MSVQPCPDLSSLLQGGDEALAIETAVRTAVTSILKVFLDVSENRARRYQLKLAEVERENIQLKFKLRVAERQLHTGQQNSCPAEGYGISADLTFSSETSRSLGTVLENEEAAAAAAVAVVCSQAVSKNEEACLGASDCNLLKKEPPYEDTFWIKNETTEENSAVDFGFHVLGHVGSSRTENFSIQAEQQRCGACSSLNHTIHHEDDTPSASLQRKRLASSERVRQYRARIRADPERYHMLKEKDRMRYLRRRKTIADLSEPMKNQKRKAWREASKRHRARKRSTQNNQYVTNTLHC